MTDEIRLLPLFDGTDVSVVVCGHTHMPFDRLVGSTRVVNAGSLGMPFGNPGADWLLIGPTFKHQHTTYDMAAASIRLMKIDFPNVSGYVQNSILNPPTEYEMLKAFARVEFSAGNNDE